MGVEILKCVWDFLGENVASIIAACAMAITFWQGWLSRKHNELSVSPELGIHWSLNHEPGEIIFELKNSGLGPAKIHSYNCKVLGKEISKGDKNLDMVKLFKKNGYPGVATVGISIIPGGTYVKEGATSMLLEVKGLPGSSHFDRKDADEIMHKIEIHIEYSSLYGKTKQASYPAQNI